MTARGCFQALGYVTVMGTLIVGYARLERSSCRVRDEAIFGPRRGD